VVVWKASSFPLESFCCFATWPAVALNDLVVLILSRAAGSGHGEREKRGGEAEQRTAALSPSAEAESRTVVLLRLAMLGSGVRGETRRSGDGFGEQRRAPLRRRSWVLARWWLEGEGDSVASPSSSTLSPPTPSSASLSPCSLAGHGDRAAHCAAVEAGPGGLVEA
jgi:hypothetical protein